MRHRAPFNERPAVVSRNRQVLPHWCNSGEATMSLNDTTPTPRGATAGIDWASDNHAVCVLDPDGAVIERQTVAHTAAGLRRLIDLLSRHRVQAVGIERGDGPVIDALLATDLTIYVITPSRSPTSCARTWPPPCPPPWICSPTSTRRSACGSWPASAPRTTWTGCRSNAYPRGWPAPPTADTPAPKPCTGASAPRPAAPPAPTARPWPASPAPTWPPSPRSPRRSTPSNSRSPKRSTPTPTSRSSPPCPRPAPYAPPGCSPRSATPAAGSPPPTPWPAWPAPHPPPASPAKSRSSRSAGP